MKNLLIGATLAVIVGVSVYLVRVQNEIISAQQFMRKREFRLVHGWVGGLDGVPIPGVKVQGIWGNLRKSLMNGEFFITASSVVRFSMTGYRPVTKGVQDVRLNPKVVLIGDPQSLWVLPPCFKSANDHLMTGWLMQFKLPPGVVSSRELGPDEGTETVCRSNVCMVLSFGPAWYGIPLQNFLEGGLGIRERDVGFQFHQDHGWNGWEYRGVRSDGTFMRLIEGAYQETIVYDRAPEETARFFDEIIDNVCSLPAK
jgi:hypothetical protein